MTATPRLVYLATAPDPVTAEAWAGLLRGEGVPVMVRDDSPAASVYLGFVGIRRLFVREDQLEEAKRLLREYLSPQP
ncbi:MAG: DUF2007 domain-containing protein [Chloroflexi bacterium]|nr:DUF2007 domain-containing protein [Chloroflexota bacterium]